MNEHEAPKSEEVASPCVQVCRLDPVTGLCEGCLRTIDEIAAWGAMSGDAKRAVWVAISQRRLENQRWPDLKTDSVMKQLTFYFDVISPYAYLAFERLPEALAGLSVEVRYQPVLFAGLLSHWGQKGPAEIPPKREWTFRQVSWLAHQQGVPMQVPTQHPFNPLALLRLALASSPVGLTPSRWVTEQVFRHVWHQGGDPNDPTRLQQLAQALAPRLDPQSDEIKQALKDATAHAVARGVFGVPTVAVDGRLFWGLDGLLMLGGYLRGDSWFKQSDWDEASHSRPGIVRKR